MPEARDRLPPSYPVEGLSVRQYEEAWQMAEDQPASASFEASLDGDRDAASARGSLASVFLETAPLALVATSGERLIEPSDLTAR